MPQQDSNKQVISHSENNFSNRHSALSNRLVDCIGESHLLSEENTEKFIQHGLVFHIFKVRVCFFQMGVMGVACLLKLEVVDVKIIIQEANLKVSKNNESFT